MVFIKIRNATHKCITFDDLTALSNLTNNPAENPNLLYDNQLQLPNSDQIKMDYLSE